MTISCDWIERGEFFFSVNRYAFLATRQDAAGP